MGVPRSFLTGHNNHLLILRDVGIHKEKDGDIEDMRDSRRHVPAVEFMWGVGFGDVVSRAILWARKETCGSACSYVSCETRGDVW